MKIKDNNILNEEALFELENKAIDSSNAPSAGSLYKSQIQAQYLQDRKKENVLVNVVVPQEFYAKIDMPKSPMDINNLITSGETNRAKKTRDFEKWNMVDPKATYDQAEDCCASAFNSIGKEKVSFAKTDTEKSLNKANVATSESITYDNYYELNEGEAAISFGAGKAIGSVGASAINVLGGFGCGLASSIIPTLGVWVGGLALGSFAVGSAMGLNTDATPIGVKGNGKEITDPGKNLIETKKKPIDFNNIPSAIENYTNKLIQSTRELLSGLSPAMLEEFNNRVAKYINNFMAQSSRQANAYIEEHSEALKEQEKLRNERELSDAKSKKARFEDYASFDEKVRKLEETNTNIDKETVIKVNKICKDYRDSYKNYDKRTKYEDAAENGSLAELIKVYDSYHPHKDSSQVNDSIQYNFESILNEAEEQDVVGNKPDVDLAKIYKGLKNQLTNDFSTVCSKFNGKEMYGLDEAKEHMNYLINEADKSIRDRITQLTKTQANGSSNDNGLTKAAIQFLAGHPLEAAGLNEIWSRHLIDLKNRMTRRVRIMTDHGNPTRTLGWTLNYMQTVLPDVFARLLTYRFGYQVLANKGMYTYNTAKADQDLELYNSSGFGKAYENDIRSILVFVLNEYSGNYTNNGQSCISPSQDENGFTLNENYLAYGTLLLNHLGLINQNNLEEIKKQATALANLDKSANGAEALLSMIYGALKNQQIFSLSSDDQNYDESFDELIKAFALPENYNQLKANITNAYNSIKKPQVNSDKEAENICKSLYMISQNPADIYKIYKDNQQDIETIIAAYKSTASMADDSDEKKQKLTKIEEDVKKYFQNISFGSFEKVEGNVYKETIDKIFDQQYHNDYYAYLLSFIDTTMDSSKFAIRGSLFSERNIKGACNMIPTLVNFALSGVLAFVEKETEKEKDEDEKKKAYETKLAKYKKELPNLIYRMSSIANKLNLVNAFNEIEDEKLVDLKNKVNTAKEGSIKQISNNYIAICKEQEATCIFKINNDVFFNKFNDCLSTFINKAGIKSGNEYHLKINDAFNSFNNNQDIKFEKNNEIKDISEALPDDMTVLLYTMGKAYERTEKENGSLNMLKKYLNDAIKYCQNQ